MEIQSDLFLLNPKSKFITSKERDKSTIYLENKIYLFSFNETYILKLIEIKSRRFDEIVLIISDMNKDIDINHIKIEIKKFIEQMIKKKVIKYDHRL
jgi:hypothetical protein